MVYRRLPTCLFFLALISLSATALPPPSLAGGRMLRLDETHDRANSKSMNIRLHSGTLMTSPMQVVSEMNLKTVMTSKFHSHFQQTFH